jgi:hypothetical protein
MICSQIWLSPLLDDCQYTYLTNFIKKNPDSGNTKDFFGGRILYFSLTYLKSDRFHAEVTLNFPRAQHATPESRAHCSCGWDSTCSFNVLELQFLPWGARERSAPLVSLPPPTPAISQPLPGSNGSKLMLHE